MRNCATCCLMTSGARASRQQSRRYACACKPAALDVGFLLPVLSGAARAK